MRTILLATSCLILAGAAPAAAEQLKIIVSTIDNTGIGGSIGTITFSDTKDGLKIEPQLTGLKTGPHGFHIHAKPDCFTADQDGKPVAGLAAGGHFDPGKTGRHLGPDGDGHKGDLPVLVADDKGEAKAVLMAPHLKVADLLEHSVMIHKFGDNFMDAPEPGGGGGPRVACGVLR